jgi:hypothetical protein
MPGMKVTLNSAMRVRDVSKPLPHHDEQALAKVADWPAARPRPASPPASRGNKPGTAPGPWRPGPERSEAPPAWTGGGHRKGQARPAPQGPGGTGQRPQAPGGTGQRPQPPASGSLGQLPQPGVTQPPRQPPATPAGDDAVSGPRPGVGRRKRVRRRRRGGHAGG